jgi:Na+-transporting methylmalonyl-CoA/oxaloacetate decarboxylase beta subunit
MLIKKNLFTLLSTTILLATFCLPWATPLLGTLKNGELVKKVYKYVKDIWLSYVTVYGRGNLVV